MSYSCPCAGPEQQLYKPGARWAGIPSADRLRGRCRELPLQLDDHGLFGVQPPGVALRRRDLGPEFGEVRSEDFCSRSHSGRVRSMGMCAPIRGVVSRANHPYLALGEAQRFRLAFLLSGFPLPALDRLCRGLARKPEMAQQAKRTPKRKRKLPGRGFTHRKSDSTPAPSPPPPANSRRRDRSTRRRARGRSCDSARHSRASRCRRRPSFRPTPPRGRRS